MDFVCSLGPLAELGDQLNLSLGGCGRVAPLLDKFGVGVEIPGPRTELRVERNERLLFHPARMASPESLQTMPNHQCATGSGCAHGGDTWHSPNSAHVCYRAFASWSGHSHPSVLDGTPRHPVDDGLSERRPIKRRPGKSKRRRSCGVCCLTGPVATLEIVQTVSAKSSPNHKSATIAFVRIHDRGIALQIWSDSNSARARRSDRPRHPAAQPLRNLLWVKSHRRAYAKRRDWRLPFCKCVAGLRLGVWPTRLLLRRALWIPMSAVSLPLQRHCRVPN